MTTPKIWNNYITHREAGTRPDLKKLDRKTTANYSSDESLDYTIAISVHGDNPKTGSHGAIIVDVLPPNEDYSVTPPNLRDIIGALDIARQDIIDRFEKVVSPSDGWAQSEGFEQMVLDVMALNRPERRGMFKRFRAWFAADDVI